MRLHAGRVVLRYRGSIHKKVTIRAPRMDDLNDMLRHINALVDEGAPVLDDKRRTRKEEAELLGKALVDLENGKRIALVAEVGGRVVGVCQVYRYIGKESHVGELEISLLKEYRGLGLGEVLMRRAMRLSKDLGLRLIVLHDIFADNYVAMRLYKKLGFRKVGFVPGLIRARDHYTGSVIMSRRI